MRGCIYETEMLTCSTVRAAFPIRYSSIRTGDHGTGDLATHSSRVLQKSQIQYMINYMDIKCCAVQDPYFIWCIVLSFTFIRLLILLNCCTQSEVIVSQYPCEQIVKASAQHLSLSRSNTLEKSQRQTEIRGPPTDVGQGKDGNEARVLSMDCGNTVEPGWSLKYKHAICLRNVYLPQQ